MQHYSEKRTGCCITGYHYAESGWFVSDGPDQSRKRIEKTSVFHYLVGGGTGTDYRRCVSSGSRVLYAQTI